MSWIRIDDAAPNHPKLLDAGPKAAWLWLCGLGYCNRQKRRDGFIPAKIVRYLYPGLGPKEARRLVEVGLWEERSDGYAVHDYHQYQPRRDDALSDVRAQAGKLGGERSGEVRAQNATLLLPAPEAVDRSPDPIPIPSRPDPDRTDQGSPLALVPVGPELGRPDSGKQRAVVDRHREQALAMLAALNGARKRAIRGAREIRATYASLEGIAARLDSGRTLDEVALVIKNCEEEVRRRPDSAQWFDAVSPFRPANFERRLAMNPSAIPVDRKTGAGEYLPSQDDFPLPDFERKP